MITPTQCRAARGLLDWTQDQLAEASGVSSATIRNFEKAKTEPQGSTVKLLEMIFTQQGVEFIAQNGGGVGVRLRMKG